jgi:hypothetical protein
MIPFLIALAAADAAPAQTPADVMAGLTGSCFRSAMPQGASDTHCFTLATGGRLVMDVHAVRDSSGKVVYQGVTVYTPAPDGKVALSYSNSLGEVMPGTVTRAGDKLDFTLTIEGQAAALSWTLSPGGYDVIGGLAPAHFTRTGAAAEPAL